MDGTEQAFRPARRNGPLQNRSKAFAIRIVQLCRVLSEQRKEFVLSRQLLKSGTSIGANLRESCGAQSTADFVSKQAIALKESYETEFWLELLVETNYIAKSDFDILSSELSRIIAMLTSSILKNKAKLARQSGAYPQPLTL